MAYTYSDFSIGEEVVIRDWDDMIEEFGANGEFGEIIIPCLFYFTSEMKYMCGEHVVIQDIRNEHGNGTAQVIFEFINPNLIGEHRGWTLSTDMIRKIDDLSYKEKQEQIKKEQETKMKEIIENTTYDFDKATHDAMELFKWCGYVNQKEETVKNIIIKAFVAKNNLREILRNHPNWNEEQQAIIFEENYQAGIDKSHLYESVCWFMDKIRDEFAKMKAPFDYNRYTKLKRMWDFYENYCEYEICCSDYVRHAIKIQGMEIKDEYEQINNLRRSLLYVSELDCYMEKRICNEFYAINKFLHMVRIADTNLIEKDDDIFDYAAQINDFWKLNPKNGQKLSRVVGKVLTHYGLNNIKDMKTVTHNGAMEPKDFGYNYYFAMFGDAINPVSFTKYTVISINPLDYWTMSFGKNWSSCQTIDKMNRRNTKKTYCGQYSSGTESYMLDETSTIFYTVDASYQGEMWKADKERRMMFHIDPSGKAMIFGRQYPDARDAEETGISAQFRNVMQKVLSDSLGFNNLWKVYKGTSYSENRSKSSGTHYRDYTKYEDTGISFATGESMPKIKIGHNPICPCCGIEHDSSDNIFCSEHKKMHTFDGDNDDIDDTDDTDDDIF